jgi:hypothetical protein
MECHGTGTGAAAGLFVLEDKFSVFGHNKAQGTRHKAREAQVHLDALGPLFLTVLDQIPDAPVVRPLPVFGKKAARDRAFGPVIPDALAAQAFLGTIVRTGTFEKIPIL